MSVPVRIRRLAPALAAAALVLALGGPEPAAGQEPAPVVVHLGHFTDDLHAASMALSIANLLQEKQVPVTLFLDREGVRLVDSRVPHDLSWGDNPSLAEKLATFAKGGGTVLICAHCAKAAGLDASKLRAGATIGSDESVAKAFLEAAKVIDY